MSDFYNKYPYTDFHELNLDWVIERVKKLTDDWLATQQEWNDTEEQWQQLHDYVMDYFANLDVSQEINDKIDTMVSDGTFLNIIRSTVESQTITTTESWLTAHITQPTTPAIDNSLSIAGAAADARQTGWLMADLYDATDTYVKNDYVNYNGNIYRCKTDIPTPEAWTSAHWIYVKAGTDLKISKAAYNPSSITGYYDVNGNFHASSGWEAVDGIIPLQAIDSIYIGTYPNVGTVVYYDKFMNFLGCELGTSSPEYKSSLNPPANTAYCRICHFTANTFKLNLNNILLESEENTTSALNVTDARSYNDRDTYGGNIMMSNLTTWSTGYIQNDGTVNPNGMGILEVSDYIPCEGYGYLMIYSVYNGTDLSNKGGFFDAAYNYLGNFGFTSGKVTIPPKAAYMKVNRLNSEELNKANDFSCTLMGGSLSIPYNFNHCVNKPYTFSGKTAVFCGDSITRGYTSISTQTANGFPKLFSDHVGMSFTNAGVAGATLTNATGHGWIGDQVQNIADLAGTDYIFIAGGINDYVSGLDINDMKTDIETICNYLQNNYSGEVIFILPIDEAGWTPITPSPYTLNDYRNMIAQVVLGYEYSVINGGLFDFPTKESIAGYKSAMFGDLLHPSEKGYRHYTKMLSTVLC